MIIPVGHILYIILFLVLNKLILVINNAENKTELRSTFSLILEKLCVVLEGNLTMYTKTTTEKRKISESIQTLIMFIYLLLYNLKRAQDVILFLRMNHYSIIKALLKAINIFKESKEDINVAKFILNLCFDDIKNKIYDYQNDKLCETYHKHVYTEILGAFPSFNEPFDVNNPNFQNFMKNVSEMKMDYYIDNLKKENSEIFCKNLIPLLLGFAQFDFISFYTNIINKHIEIIRKEYDNELTSLFRKDDVTNDLMKNLIIIFGNYSFIKSFYTVIPNDFLKTNDVTFDLKLFETFLKDFVINLIESLPFIIKVLLTIIKNSIQKINSGKENYNVVYTVLIFNFFISPSVLELYGISLVKFKSLRQLTRILRNICFGKEFDTNDKLSYFNTKIKDFNLFINGQFKTKIFDIIDIENKKDDINKEINNSFVSSKNVKDINQLNCDTRIVFPTFCFQYYWENIRNVVNSLKK